MSTDLLADLLDVADALTDPQQLRTPLFMWDANRNKKKIGDHVVTIPGLLTQLAGHAYPGSTGDDTGSARPVPASRPPLQIQALSAWMEMNVAVVRWCHHLRIGLRDTLESNLRAVLGKSATLPHARTQVAAYACPTCLVGHDREHWDPCHHCHPITQVELITELRGWQRRAEVITGERQADPQVEAPCPHCGNRRLRINLTDYTARCGDCPAEWSEEGVPLGVLAQHIAQHREASKAAADEARRVARKLKEIRYARPATPVA